VVVVFLLGLTATYFVYQKVPTSFVPQKIKDTFL